ncbi:MAG: hypothetical protein WCS70_07775 [Verrucomicrobiota bacterium]
MNLPATATRRWSILATAAGWLGGTVAIVWFAVLLFQHHIDYVPEVDSQGYFLMARSFSQFEWPRWPEDLGRFYGHVWVQVGDQQVMAKYPPGWPVFLALGYWVAGLAGALWVNPVLAVISAAAFFLLAWRLFNSTVACIATTLWLFSPMVPAYLNYPLSHTADVTLVLLAFLFTVVWAQTGRGWTAVAAGLCAGFLPAIRPVNVLLWPALVALVWATAERRPGRVRLFLIAWAVPVTLLAAYNWFSFGAPWRTGYALTGEQTGFDWRLLGERGRSLATTAQTFLEPRWWWLILAGVAVSWRRWKLATAFALWIVPFVLTYGSYYFFYPNETSLRFLLAVLPAVILSGGFLLPTDARIRLAVLAGFGLWLALAPPAFLMTLQKIQAGHRYTLAEARTTAVIRLTGMLTEVPTRYPADLLHRQLGQRPAALYATDRVGWTLGSEIGVINYDLLNWADPHFFEPPVDQCAHQPVWEDPRRHSQRHTWYARLGAAGLRQDFLHHLRHDLAADRAVYFVDEPGLPMRQWLRAEPDLIVEPAELPALLRIRQVLPAR